VNNEQARAVAFDILKRLIEHQPNLINMGPNRADRSTGQDAAQFCASFVNTFAAELIKQQS